MSTGSGQQGEAGPRPAVFAGYGLAEDIPARLARAGLGRAVILDTALEADRDEIRAAPNRHYEFSAYGRGLDHWRDRLEGADWILFANSTLFETRTGPGLIAALLAALPRAPEAAEAAGIRHDNGVAGPFLTTNLFALRPRVALAEGFAFVPPDLAAFREEATAPADLERRFGAEVHDRIAGRLHPRHPWAGWHRATWRRPIPDAVFLRKAFTILCEHRLTAGLRLHDIATDPGARARIALFRGEVAARKLARRAGEYIPGGGG